MRKEAGEKFVSKEAFLPMSRSSDFITEAILGYFSCSFLALIILLGSSQVTSIPSINVCINNFKRTRERMSVSRHLCFSAALWPRMQSSLWSGNSAASHHPCYLKQKSKEFCSVMNTKQNNDKIATVIFLLPNIFCRFILLMFKGQEISVSIQRR